MSLETENPPKKRRKLFVLLQNSKDITYVVYKAESQKIINWN